MWKYRIIKTERGYEPQKRFLLIWSGYANFGIDEYLREYRRDCIFNTLEGAKNFLAKKEEEDSKKATDVKRKKIVYEIN